LIAFSPSHSLTLSPSKQSCVAHHKCAVIQDDVRRFVLDEVLELAPELLHGQAGGGRDLRARRVIVKIVAPKANHVAPGNGVPGGGNVDRARARAGGGWGGYPGK